jgi:hypothetical protein
MASCERSIDAGSGWPAAAAPTAGCRGGTRRNQARVPLVHQVYHLEQPALEFGMPFRSPLQLAAGCGDAIIQVGGRMLGPLHHD